MKQKDVVARVESILDDLETKIENIEETVSKVDEDSGLLLGQYAAGMDYARSQIELFLREISGGVR
jgi:hypothetical protein